MTENLQGRAGVYGRQSRGKAKSIAEQVTAGTEAATDNGWTVVQTYRDGTSASRYARKGRDDWQRVLDDITAGALDILVLWEASRGDRNLTTWSGLLDLCRKKKVSIYVVADERLYDPNKARDWKTLASAGVDSAGESDLLSVRVRRGHEGAAKAGRPSHGRTPFGYVRHYDANTGELASQDPHPDHAPIVREIFDRLAAGEPIVSVVNDFNARQVPTSGAKAWYRVRVRDIAMNPAYVSARVYNGTTSEGTWPALVEPAVFYAVQRILTDPSRVTTKPGKVRHLLSYLAVCHLCEGPLCAVRGRYRCLKSSCTTVVQADTDQLVTGMVLARLEQPDVYEALRRMGAETDRAAMQAEGEVGKLEARLAQWRASAARDETSPASLAVIEADLTAQITALTKRANLASVPPELRLLLEPGADVRTRWYGAPLPAQRRVIEHMAEIRIDRADLPGSRYFDLYRLGRSRWAGDSMTWGERWEKAGV